MLADPALTRRLLLQAIRDAAEQGHVVDGLERDLAELEGADALAAFAQRVRDLPLRDDWPYVEPDDLAAIRAECDPDRAREVRRVDDGAERVGAAFCGRVCGCMLGKPFEIQIRHEEIRAALETTGEWPLTDYATEATLRALPTLQGQWRELARERIAHVVPDDDINYTILAMLVLEQHGLAFTQEHLKALWLLNLPVLATFGPERTFLTASALENLGGDPFDSALLNPGAELCGALIRADAYGYARLGDPEGASTLAHRDASMTHRRTGVYGAMFAAAAIAIAPFADGLDIAREALRYVPQRSRFAERTRECIDLVAAAHDWLEARDRVHERFGEYGFCRIYQEVGTLINTLRFARNVGDGICLQVMQGNDTDSFGATAGSILGAHFGRLDARWTRPFNDDVHTALANFHERSLDRIAERMSALPSIAR